MFAVANLARRLDLDAEATLRRATAKFESRFRAMEAVARTEARPLAGRSPAELETLWQAAKRKELP